MRRRICTVLSIFALAFGAPAAFGATQTNPESIPVPRERPGAVSPPVSGQQPGAADVPLPRARPDAPAVTVAQSDPVSGLPVPPEKPVSEAAAAASAPIPPGKPVSETSARSVPVPGEKPQAAAPGEEPLGTVPSPDPAAPAEREAVADTPVPEQKPEPGAAPDRTPETADDGEESGPPAPVVSLGPPQGPPFFADDAMSPACPAIEEGRVSGRPLKPQENLDGYCLVPAIYGVSSVGTDRAVTLAPEAELNCAMTDRLDGFVEAVIEPAAREILETELVELGIAGSYVCRPRNGQAGAKQSEHGKANAIDIARFVMADGRTISVAEHWSSDGAEADFLRTVHEAACGPFHTVIGPDGDDYHQDHFHLDLQKRGADGRTTFCQ